MQSIQEKFWIVLRLQLYVIYLLLQHSYQKIKEVFGVAAAIADIPDGHVRMFIYYLALDPGEIAKRNDFVLAGGHFESIELMNNSQWSVYCIERALAVAEVKRSDKFAEALEKQSQPKTHFSRTQLAVVVRC
ncbi:unnamed protein product [Cylicocyclus nassatus]|uniref:Uncharacterized protein n=1 Tax=Cylicocyclus nassatus TaxID=53992 RepID=A0AA36GK69_CYLNA|nr:unnamed protein product [Cylicocyclus nassatus]